MFLYRGPAASTTTSTPEESDDRMAAFAAVRRYLDRTEAASYRRPSMR